MISSRSHTNLKPVTTGAVVFASEPARWLPLTVPWTRATHTQGMVAVSSAPGTYLLLRHHTNAPSSGRGRKTHPAGSLVARMPLCDGPSTGEELAAVAAAAAAAATA